jgi:hypothetical protein
MGGWGRGGRNFSSRGGDLLSAHPSGDSGRDIRWLYQGIRGYFSAGMGEARCRL